MRLKIFSWLGREFVSLSGEAQPLADASEEAQSLFARFDDELRKLGLSLHHVVRTRLWAKDRQSRDLGSQVRVAILSGPARSASSSYIAPGHFDSNGSVALDLLALRPLAPDTRKHIVEYQPPIVPIRFLVYDSIVVLSGVTTVLPTLEAQLDVILARIQDSLHDAGSSWNKVARISFYLHRSQRVETLNETFAKHVKAKVPQRVYGFVDGYSSVGKLCEIEVTASV